MSVHQKGLNALGNHQHICIYINKSIYIASPLRKPTLCLDACVEMWTRNASIFSKSYLAMPVLILRRPESGSQGSTSDTGRVIDLDTIDHLSCGFAWNKIRHFAATKRTKFGACHFRLPWIIGLLLECMTLWCITPGILHL